SCGRGIESKRSAMVFPDHISDVRLSARCFHCAPSVCRDRPALPAYSDKPVEKRRRVASGRRIRHVVYCSQNRTVCWQSSVELFPRVRISHTSELVCVARHNQTRASHPAGRAGDGAALLSGVLFVYGIRSLTEGYLTNVHTLLHGATKRRRFSPQ